MVNSAENGETILFLFHLTKITLKRKPGTRAEFNAVMIAAGAAAVNDFSTFGFLDYEFMKSAFCRMIQNARDLKQLYNLYCFSVDMLGTNYYLYFCEKQPTKKGARGK